MKYRLFYTHALRFRKALSISGRILRGNSATSFVLMYILLSFEFLQSSYQYQLSRDSKSKNFQNRISLFIILHILIFFFFNTHVFLM